MKTKTLFLTIAISLIFLTSMPAMAQEREANPQLLARMEQMLSEGEWKALNLTGKPKGLWLLHQAKISRIVDQLKAGKSVDPREIDELLKEHSR